jgi:hypothetical protein
VSLPCLIHCSAVPRRFLIVANLARGRQTSGEADPELAEAIARRSTLPSPACGLGRGGGSDWLVTQGAEFVQANPTSRHRFTLAPPRHQRRAFRLRPFSPDMIDCTFAEQLPDVGHQRPARRDREVEPIEVHLVRCRDEGSLRSVGRLGFACPSRRVCQRYRIELPRSPLLR